MWWSGTLKKLSAVALFCDVQDFSSRRSAGPRWTVCYLWTMWPMTVLWLSTRCQRRMQVFMSVLLLENTGPHAAAWSSSYSVCMASYIVFIKSWSMIITHVTFTTIIGRESDQTTRWIREAIRIRQEGQDIVNRDEGVFLLSHIGALWHIDFLRLRNILTYLLTYIYDDLLLWETTVKRAASSSHWKHCSSVSISVSSALEVFLYTTMFYINRRFTYLLSTAMTVERRVFSSKKVTVIAETSLV